MGTNEQKRFTVLLMVCLVGALGGFAVPTPGIDALQAAEPDAAGDWFQFLGPDRNGVSRESGLMKTWPTGGPKRVWQVAGGGTGGSHGESSLANSVGRRLQEPDGRWSEGDPNRLTGTPVCLYW